MTGPPERPRLVVRIRGKLWPVAAWALLLVAARRRSPTELWIGDSHAMTFNQGIDNAMFFRTPQGQLILRVGARRVGEGDLSTAGKSAKELKDADAIVRDLAPRTREKDVVLIMSNGGFGGIHQKFLDALGR